jgi:hypothetical protein
VIVLRKFAIAVLSALVFGAYGGELAAQQQQPVSLDSAVSDESRYALEAILQRLRADSRDARRQAVDQLRSLEPGDVPAIRQRLLSPLGMSHLQVHAAMVRAIRQVTGGRENVDYDLLQALINYAPRSPDIDVATERIALATALGHIQTPDSGRALVAFGLAHNRIFRLASIRIAKNQLKLYVLPALIEIRRPTEDQRLFIRQMREAIRCVTPGQSVQTRDNALLAEILRAWGSVRQQDAMAVIASFVNSDRVQVREAARWAIAQFGRDALHTLRNVYETYVGEDPNPQWGWERVARELYAAYDRRKNEEVRAALDAGLAAAREGRNEEMLQRFQWVLARHPLFERRTEMVEPLVRYAQQLERTDGTRAAMLYRMALRVDPEGARASSIRASILFLEAERALARGVADPELYRAALVADPSHERARAQLEAVAQVEVLRARRRRRAIGAVGLLALALAGAGVLYHESKKRANARTRGVPKERAPEVTASSTVLVDSESSGVTSESIVAFSASSVAPAESSGDAAMPRGSNGELQAELGELSRATACATSGEPAIETPCAAQRASAERTVRDADSVAQPTLSTATSSREPGLVDLLVTVAGAAEKKKFERR